MPFIPVAQLAMPIHLPPALALISTNGKLKQQNINFTKKKFLHYLCFSCDSLCRIAWHYLLFCSGLRRWILTPYPAMTDHWHCKCYRQFEAAALKIYLTCLLHLAPVPLVKIWMWNFSYYLMNNEKRLCGEETLFLADHTKQHMQPCSDTTIHIRETKCCYGLQLIHKSYRRMRANDIRINRSSKLETAIIEEIFYIFFFPFKNSIDTTFQQRKQIIK